VKITQKSPDAVQAPRPSAGEARGPVTAPPAPDASELIHLSPTSARLAAGQTQAGEAPVDIDRIERIKEAIRNGEFSVNAEAVADKLLEIERDLAPGQ
jgi:negative regulator of flagellin synthesis FlgM